MVVWYNASPPSNLGVQCTDEKGVMEPGPHTMVLFMDNDIMQYLL